MARKLLWIYMVAACLTLALGGLYCGAALIAASRNTRGRAILSR